MSNERCAKELTDQDLEELEAFRKFANLVNLEPISEPTKQCWKEKRPDIRAELSGRGVVEYELGEVVDEGVRADWNRSDTLPNIYVDAVNRHAESEQILKKLEGALVQVWLVSDVTSNAAQNAADELVTLLLELEITRPVTKKDFPESRIFRRMTITFSSEPGFAIYLPPGTRFTSVPVLEMLKKKFDKNYNITYPCELVLHFNGLQNTHTPQWMDDAKTYLHKNLRGSNFRRVWIVDLWARQVLLDYSAS